MRFLRLILRQGNLPSQDLDVAVLQIRFRQTNKILEFGERGNLPADKINKCAKATKRRIEVLEKRIKDYGRYCISQK